MVDYISREAAIEALENTDADVCEQYPDGYCNWGISRAAIKAMLKNVPTADVEPVRHVRREVWFDTEGGEWLRCPRCGFNFNTVFAKFCGGCSAKMDLEGEQ